MNIPNALSLVRIFLVPVLVVFLIVVPRPDNLLAAAVFMAAV
ncbi:MAG: CDP-alcohol phosphatidyltransferase family protein, partial [candidate division NC10 bacterium]